MTVCVDACTVGDRQQSPRRRTEGDENLDNDVTDLTLQPPLVRDRNAGRREIQTGLIMKTTMGEGGISSAETSGGSTGV